MAKILECPNCGDEFEYTGAKNKALVKCKWCEEEYCPTCGHDGMHGLCRERAAIEEETPEIVEDINDEELEEETDDVEDLDFRKSFIDDSFEDDE